MAWTTPQNFTTGQVVDEADMDAISDNFSALLPVNQVAWATWSPTYSNITVGNGTVAATYTQIGKLVVARWKLTWGSTTAFSGTPVISLPVTSIDGSGIMRIVGGAYFDDSAATNYQAASAYGSTTTASLRTWSVASNFPTLTNCSATVPHTWATSDIADITWLYEAA